MLPPPIISVDRGANEEDDEEDDEEDEEEDEEEDDEEDDEEAAAFSCWVSLC